MLLQVVRHIFMAAIVARGRLHGTQRPAFNLQLKLKAQRLGWPRASGDSRQYGSMQSRRLLP